MLVHEWAHYRWGIYDEYPTTAAERFYKDKEGIQATKCNKNIKGDNYNSKVEFRLGCATDTKTGLPDKNCRFYPDMAPGRQNVSGSFMYYQYMSQVCSVVSQLPAETYREKKE